MPSVYRKPWRRAKRPAQRWVATAVGVADVTPPTLSGFAIPSAGTTLTANLSEAGCVADGGGTSGTGGFTLAGTSATVSSWAISGATLTLTLSGTVLAGQTVTTSYSRAGTTDDIKDAAGNYLADFSGAAVTNDSTQFTANLAAIIRRRAASKVFFRRKRFRQRKQPRKRLTFGVASGPVSVAVDNAAIKYSPDNWLLVGGTHVISNTPGAYFKTNFSGTSLKLNVDVAALSGAGALEYPTILYSIDGDALVRYQLTSADSQLTLATGLASAVHTFELIFAGVWWQNDRWNGSPPVSALKITGLVLDVAAAPSAPTVYSSKMVVYGDSVSEGYESLAPGVSVANQDASLVAGLLIGRAFQCEVGVIAFAGQAFSGGGGGNVPALTSSWNLYYAGQSRLSGGLFMQVPDYIFCCMGQNDGGSVQAAVQSLITAWRAAAPSAKIVFCTPATLNHTTDLLAGVAASGDANAYYVTTGEDMVGPWVGGQDLRFSNSNHLSGRGHARYAAAVIRGAQVAVGGGGAVGPVPMIGSPLIRSLQ